MSDENSNGNGEGGHRADLQRASDAKPRVISADSVVVVSRARKVRFDGIISPTTAPPLCTMNLAT